MYPDAKVILFCDNQTMVSKVTSDKEVHPFATDYADFCRQTVTEHNITVKWCPSDKNLADRLTKPSKW